MPRKPNQKPTLTEMTVTMEIMDGLQTELEKRYPGRG